MGGGFYVCVFWGGPETAVCVCWGGGLRGLCLCGRVRVSPACTCPTLSLLQAVIVVAQVQAGETHLCLLMLHLMHWPLFLFFCSDQVSQAASPLPGLLHTQTPPPKHTYLTSHPTPLFRLTAAHTHTNTQMWAAATCVCLTTPHLTCSHHTSWGQTKSQTQSQAWHSGTAAAAAAAAAPMAAVARRRLAAAMRAQRRPALVAAGRRSLHSTLLWGLLSSSRR